MKKSKFTILLLFLVMILAISAASAADLDDNSDSAVQAVDEAAVDEVASADVDDVVSTDNTANVLADVGDKNFTVLKEDINTAPNGVLEVKSNYVRADGEDDIVISKDIIMIGDDTHKIDANKLGAIFKVNEGCKLILQDVILVNGNNNYGGAIYNEGTVSLASSHISNSNASVGGAIYNKGIVLISGSTLDENSATTLGGAIYSEGKLTVGESNFINNKVTTASAYNPGVNSNGGAGIFSSEGSNLTVTGSIFTGNEAIHPEFGYFTSGGAIYVYRAVNTLIDDCTFNDNVAGLGGAIIFEGISQDGIALSNSRFTNNSAWQGGAVNVNEFVGNLNIAGNNFTGNDAVGPNLGGPSAEGAFPASGGAVSIGTMQTTDTTVEITDCDFTQNTAEGGAGAISINANTEVAIENCDFIENEASYGIAIVSAGNTKINGSRFIGNKNGFATIYLSDSENSITNSNFSDNEPEWDVASFKGKLTLSNNEMNSDSATIIAYTNDDETPIVSTNFIVTILENGTVTTNNGIATITAKVTDDNNNLIDYRGNIKFIINDEEVIAKYNSTSKLYQASYTLPTPGIYVVNITAPDATFTIKTGAVKNTKGSFYDLKTQIDATTTGSLELGYDFAYTPIIDDEYGYVKGIEISNDISIDGKGHTINGSDSHRIFYVSSYATLTLDNIVLTNGNATLGGAILISNGNIIISNVNLTNNKATKHGGAIYYVNELTDDSEIINCVFENNEAIDGSGGAIAFFDETYSVYSLAITNTNFTNNKAGAAAGAIYVGEETTVYIENSLFDGNEAPEGDAIYNWYGYLYLDGNTINSEDAEIYNVLGFIDSIKVTTFNATVAYGEKVNLTAIITDNNGNLIYDSGFVFLVKGSDYIAKYNATTKKYELKDQVFNLPVGTYDITVDNEQSPDDIVYIHKGILTATPKKGTFADLQYQINALGDGETLDLTYDFTYTTGYDDDKTLSGFDLSKGIIINQNIIINGNVHKISGADANRIFYVNYTSTLTLNNGTLSNGYHNTYGGAVYLENIGNPTNKGGSLIADHVTFTDNSANQGGAVYVKAYASLDLTNCVFENNNATTTNTGKGGAIFTNYMSSVSIRSSNFTNNTGYNGGGAINLGSTSTVLIDDCKFKENKATRPNMANGGALLISSNEVTITGCDFINNTASLCGGAIYMSTNNVNMEINGSTFIGNKAGTNANSYGGAVYLGFSSTTTIKGSTFENNYYCKVADNDVANAIFLNSGNLYLEENTINTEHAEILLNAKGSPKITSPVTVKVLNNEIIDTTGSAHDLTAVLYDDKGNLIEDSNLKFSVNDGEGFAYTTFDAEKGYTFADYDVSATGIYVVSANTTRATNLTVETGIIRNVKGTFTDLQNIINAAETELILTDDFTYDADIDGADFVDGVKINKTLTIKGDNHKLNGTNSARIFNINATDVVLNNITFTNGKAEKGGAIYYNLVNGTLTVENSRFYNNNATTDKGGAIFVWYGEPTVTGSEFINNTAYANGGAICFWRGVGNISDSYFETNNATNGVGGAINLAVGGNVTDCEFVNNDAFGTNPALAVGGTNAYVANCNFTGSDCIWVTGTATLENNKELTAKDDVGYSVRNAGKGLTLINNKFNSKIINGKTAKIISDVNATVLGNKIIETTEDTYELTATIVDGSGNWIKYEGIKFLVNGEEIDATYNSTTGLYTATLDTSKVGIYEINLTKVDRTVYNAIIRNIKGTFTDLQKLIDEAGTNLELPYNFTYTESIDGDKFTKGILIDTAIEIDGKGNTISGNDTVRIFNINATDVVLNNITFTNGKAEKGGAIYYNLVNGTLTVENSRFYNNNATTDKGGAIFVWYGEPTVTGSEFINNTAYANGGAICFWRGVGNISDSYFETNNATNGVGGAINLAVGGNVTDCEFVNNDAFGTNPALAIGGTNAYVANCNFTGSDCIWVTGTATLENNKELTAKDDAGYSVLNVGKGLTLINNKFNSIIKVLGKDSKIISTMNATILENKTIDANLSDEVPLTLVLTDGAGNLINDPNVKFTVNSGEPIDATYNNERGLYEATYTIVDAGLNVVSTNYPAENIKTGAYEVEKENATLTVTVEDIIDGQNATVFVTLTGVNGIGLNDTVTVIVNNKEYPIVVTNGTGNETIKNLTHGSYPVVAMLNESANYNKAINSTVFYVKSTTAIVIEGPTENVTYGEPVTIKVTVTTSDSQPFNGLITLGYYETEFDVIINNGNGSYTFDANTYFLGKGEHEFIAVYDGNNDYNASESNRIKFNVTAKELTKDNVTVSYVGIAPENVTLTIVSPVDGTYNVTVNGNTVQVEVKDGKGSAEIDGKYLNAGNNVANVTIDDENYALDMTVNITYRTNATFDVTFSGTYPNLEITIEGTDGNYTVYIDDTHKVDITVAGGKGNGTISDIAAGNYSAEVYFDVTDEYYEGYKHYDEVIVAQATPTISVVAKEVTWPTAVNVTVTSDVSGKYTVKVGDKSKEVTLEANVASDVTFEGLDANENGYAINVTYAETENYTAAVNDTEKVIVKKADAVFNATVATPVVYPNNVTVTVNSTVAGKVTITIFEGNPHVFNVEAGVTDLPISDVPVGTYSGITVHFEADNYNSADKDITFEVTKGTPEFNVTAIVAKDTYPGAVTIIVTSDINAKFNVTVGSETKEVEVANGLGYETFTGIAAGIDNATVTFIEDTHFKETSKVEKFTAIAKSAPEFTVTPVLIVDTYKGKVNITITGVDGTYSIQINDVGTNALPISGEIIVSGGKGSKVFENLTAGDKEVTATIDESANYTAGEGSATFTVKKATIEIKPKATGEFIVDGKINVTFKLPTDIDGTVIVYVDGDADPQAPTPVEGVYTFEFDAFNAGSHTFVATLTGDSNYADAMGQTTFDVEKVNVTISIVPDNSVPNPENILIKVADNATGTILIEIPGYLTLQQYEIENGTYTLDLGPIPANDYKIFVTYMGDDKYNNGSANDTFTIVKLTAPEVIVNITDTEIVGEKDVVVNITVGDNLAYPGNVTVYVDGTPTQTFAIDEYGNVTVTVPALENGTHTIGVKYDGNAYFNASDIVNKTVTVTKGTSSVTIDPVDNVTYGKAVVIKYTIVNETDSVTILVTDEAGNIYDITVEDGVITIEDVIPAGKYTVFVHNGESGFYTESEANITFNVTKGPEIDINVAENTTTPAFTITLPEDAEGNLLVDIDGNHYYAPVVNGTATVTVPPLAAGNYTANITYTGDGKYPEISKTTNVSVPSNLPENAISIPTSTSNLNPTFGVNLPSDAGGYIEVDVDGKKYYAGVENGKASVSLPGLATGQHKVTVTYSGDGKYTKASQSATVTVTDPIPGLSGNKNVNVIYSASATYKVRVTLDGKAAAGQTVAIKFNGKTYNVKSDANGYATLKLNTKVKPKTYTITATYKGITVKNKVKVKHILKVKNKVVKKSKKVTKVKITFKKISKTSTKKSKSKTRVIKIKFRGKTYKVKTKSRVATWKVKKSMVKKLKVGKKYKYRVTYGKDVITKKLTIKR